MKTSTSFVLGSLLVLGCSSTATQVAPDAATVKTHIASASAGDLAVDLLADGPLGTGLTSLYLEIATAQGTPVTDAAVAFVPVMSMSTGMNHSGPILGPPALGSDGLYRVDVVFIMASTDVDTWSAAVAVARPGAEPVQASFPLLTVADTGRVRTFTYTDPVSAVATKYVSSLNFMAAPTVGLNPIVFTLHYKQDMTTFPSVDDAQILLDPEMPSMGHGSPGSVDPTLIAPGRYQGQLSFSMAGEWQTTVTLERAGATIGAPVFATTF